MNKKIYQLIMLVLGVLLGTVFLSCNSDDADSTASSGSTTTYGSEQTQVTQYFIGKGFSSTEGPAGMQFSRVIEYKTKMLELVEGMEYELLTSKKGDKFCDIMISSGAEFPMTDDEGCVTTCEADSNEMGMSCTDTTSSFTCEHTYTASSTNFTVSIDFSGVTFSENPTGTLTVDAEVSATVNGGDFSDTSMSCNMDFSMDMSTMDEDDEDIEPDCDTATISCTFGSTSYSCAELMEMDATDQSCGS